MKQKLFYLTLLFTLLFTSCKDDKEVLAPDISGIETKEYTLNIGDKLVLAPNIKNLENNIYVWTLDGKEVANETAYTFIAKKAGNFVIAFRAKNKGGTSEQTFKIKVEKSITIVFEKENLTVPRCEVLEIKPNITGPDRSDYKYEWAISDSIVGKQPVLNFISVTASATYSLKLTVSAGKQKQSATCKVKMEDKECSQFVNSMLEYKPVPVRGFNWTKLGRSKKRFVYPYEKYLEIVSEEIRKDNFRESVALGWWGGYAVFGFDHTIVNIPRDADVRVLVYDYHAEGTTFYVAYDKNKNGKPDEDEWYEIKGSRYGREDVKDYSITFTHKGSNVAEEKQTYEWKDNQGNIKERTTGIKSKNFPGYNFLNGESIFLKGWNQSFTRKGKLVNKRIHSGMQGRYTYNLNINDAVNNKGESVFLPGIDFIKVQNTGIIYWGDEKEPFYKNKKIYGIRDLHLAK